MTYENNQVITYQGKPITLLSDDQEDASVNLTEMAKAFGQPDSIKSWIRDGATQRFLVAWEEKYNLLFKGSQADLAILSASPREELSIKYFIDKTNAIGIQTVDGAQRGIYAHQDIALRFAAYLSPEFELFILSELRRLRKLEQEKEASKLLSHDEILQLVQLKEVFKYVAHQEFVEKTHKDVFVAQSGSEDPYSEFYVWRNEVLNMDRATIDERVKKYCIEKNIPLIRGSKREKILAMDCYESVRIAVWDFLEIKGEENALTLAGLVKDMIKTEKGTIKRVNETNLFESKQNLGEYTDFENAIAKIPVVNAAKSTLEIRAQVGDRTKKLGR
jgi:hypothetical protein